MKTILITGGAGFIGSHVANLFQECGGYNVVVLDSLTYASNQDYLNSDIPLIHGDIRDKSIFEYVSNICGDIYGIIHLAAESHVDNSIESPDIFIETNIVGTHNLLNFALNKGVKKFYHVSTDEVYGHLSLSDKPFTEETPYDPRSPYSASKAASDHLVRAYHNTYQLPILISNCSNNYGINQHDEKLIPTIIKKILNDEPIPIYGTGENIRDWLWVGDHALAIKLIFENGIIGETYNIGGDNEMSNLEMVKSISNIMGKPNHPINFIEDRKGHDFRYAIDCTKLKSTLGWIQEKEFEDGMNEVINFYTKKFA